MRPALLLLLFSLVSFTPALAAQSPWRLFGSFELQLKTENGPVTVRMTDFSNGEVLAEREERGVKQQRLTVQPSGLQLFAGLDGKESPESRQKNPFTFIEGAFPYPIMVLETAYQSGPDSVPEAAEVKEMMLEGKYPATLQASRPSAATVRFHLIRREGDRIDEIDGLWEADLQPPLPDTLPLTGWEYTATASLHTLGEARALERVP
ncbi:MAG: hypothetical protein P4L42_10840 [Desulfocapsaceae bacterium]|nr:hypothetical protein [Desulfocapsaceae bacterium]